MDATSGKSRLLLVTGMVIRTHTTVELEGRTGRVRSLNAKIARLRVGLIFAFSYLVFL